MKALTRWMGMIAVVLVAACAPGQSKISSPATSEFKSNIAAPPGYARIYILPTLSMGMFSDLEGIANIGLFLDGSEKGAPLASTDRSTFVGFDLLPGTYDLMAYNGPITKVTKSISFTAGNVYFLRPVFFRSAKDLSKSGSGMGAVGNGMGFDPVPPTVARTEIARMNMASLRPRGQNFLNQITNRSTTQPSGPSPVDSSFQSTEQKLLDLQKLYKEGLITQSEYDAKRQAILNAY